MHFGLFSDLESKDLWEKKKTNWEEEDDKVGVVRSWSNKLATQRRSPVTAFIFIFVFVFCFYFFFLLLFLLLLFLLSISIIVVSVSHLLSICVCADSFVFFLCFQGPFTWLTLGKKKTFNFWIKDGKVFQPLDFCYYAHDVIIDRFIWQAFDDCQPSPLVNTKEKSNWVKQKNKNKNV